VVVDHHISLRDSPPPPLTRPSLTQWPDHCRGWGGPPVGLIARRSRGGPSPHPPSTAQPREQESLVLLAGIDLMLTMMMVVMVMMMLMLMMMVLVVMMMMMITATHLGSGGDDEAAPVQQRHIQAQLREGRGRRLLDRGSRGQKRCLGYQTLQPTRGGRIS
jgi:hypothetical protein